MLDDAMIEEFKVEAQEMFENSEDGFLKIEKGENFTENYNLIFRAFHSLKGAAGMFGLDDLQGHMHKLESLFEAQKNAGKLDKAQIDYFLQGIDGAKVLIEGGSIDFTYFSIEEFKNISQVERKQATPSVEKALSTTTPAIDKKRGLFYIVDDEDGILMILEDLISELGFSVRTFLSAKELMVSVKTDAPDVILSDINMPDISGLELLRLLHTEEVEAPVIFISGYISKEIMMNALDSGAYGFIEKPFNEVYLKSICENAFLKVQTQHLLQKSINYIIYQFSDLDQYLKDQGKEALRQSLKIDLKNILEQQKTLKELQFKK